MTKQKKIKLDMKRLVTIGTCGIVEFVFLVRGPGDSSVVKFHLLPICTSFVVFRLESNSVVEKAICDSSARHDCFTPLTILLRATLFPSSVPK